MPRKSLSNTRRPAVSGISAAGTTQGTATPITTDVVHISTAASGSGVVLPATETGLVFRIVNKGANAVLIYPAVSSAIDALAANAGYSLAVNSSIMLVATGATQWYTFGSSSGGTVTSVTGTAPVVSSGGTTPAISMAAATTSVNGYLTSTDWNTFNNKVPTSGTGASGTWGISITGNAATATNTIAALTMNNGGAGASSGTTFNGATAQTISYNTIGATAQSAFATSPWASVKTADIRNLTNPSTGIGYPAGVRFRFSSLNDDSTTPYADAMDLSTYADASGGGYNSLYFGKNSQVIQHKYAAAGGTSWTTKTLQYTDGTSASGTWGISITGSAAQLGGVAAASYALKADTHFIGTTSIALNRASAAQSLTGITSIDGTASAWTTGRTFALTGDVTGTSAAMTGSANLSWATAIADATVTGKVLTGYAAGTNTALAATDTILAAMGKIQGQITARSGTVTSVSGTGTVSGLSLSGTVTTTGNITLGGTLSVAASDFASQTANTFLCAPNGSAGVPTFRTIAVADVPTLNQNTTGSSGSCTGNSATATNSTQLGGVAAASYALKADTHFIGTTSIALNRTSASQTLTGVSIDGNAATVTSGVYTSGYQTIAGNKHFTGTVSGIEQAMTIAVSDEATAITTGTAKVTFRAPFGMTLSKIPRASLSTASTSGIPTVDINIGGSTVLSTKLTIDANEKTSTTAATAAVLSTTTVADDAEITIDIDVAGTGAKGLKVMLFYKRQDPGA